MPAQTPLVAVLVAVAAVPTSVRARTELVQRKGPKGALRATVDADLFQNQLRDALGDILGCGDDLKQESLDAIEKKLLPVWKSLPKSASGRIERPLLRYMAYRYFSATSSIILRGFERSQPANQSADILSKQVPAYVEATLESMHAQDRGFDLRDAVRMVATLRKLIIDSDAGMLEEVYQEQGSPLEHPVGESELAHALSVFMTRWILGDDKETLMMFWRSPDLLTSSFPRWREIQNLIRGQISAFSFKRQRSGGSLSQQFSFRDAREVMWSITSSFAEFWEGECAVMKDKLVDMDTHHTGRVPLSNFYSRRLSAEWRFGESEDYLRQLGALDESSRWHGKQVIIPNYIGAASNCIVSTPHYFLCCMDSCEGHLNHIEVGIGASVASPEQILALVGNMTSQTTLDDDEPLQIKGSLARQLDQIASAHGGKIPLHGRLFAQWLHYAFPRECPFPHKTGATSQMAPNEFGNYVVSEDDRLSHAGTAVDVPVEVQKETTQWMSQWSSEEELISDYSVDLRPPWEIPISATIGIIVLVVASITGVLGMGAKTGASSTLLPTSSPKAHFV